MNLNEINAALENKIVATSDKLNQTMSAAFLLQRNMATTLRKLQMILPALNASLDKQGFEIAEIHSYKTGMNHEAWVENDSLRVEINAKALDRCKVKFVPFRGYTAGGQTKNDAAITRKAEQMEALLIAATGLARIGVNSRCFEADADKPHRALITFFIKPA